MREVFRERGVVAGTKGRPAIRISHPAVTRLLSGHCYARLYFTFFGGYPMTHYLKKIPDSVFGLKNVRTLAAVAMLLALRIVLGMFANATLACFGNTVKLSAAFIPIAVTGALFGPVPSALVGALGDVLSFIIAPTGGAYFPGFTISGLLTGLIYGIALYGERLSRSRGRSTPLWQKPSSRRSGSIRSTPTNRPTPFTSRQDSSARQSSVCPRS